MVKSSSGKKNMRSFTVSNVTKHGGCDTKYNEGRFISRNPAGAAKKAFNQFCRQKKIKGVCTLFVTVEETTQGSKHKEFTYKLKRNKLTKPIIMMKGTDNEYVIEYAVEAKSVDSPKSCKNKGQSVGRMSKKTTRKNKKSANNVRRSNKNNKKLA